MPVALVDQLKVGGRMVAIFQNGRLGTVRYGLKTDTGMNWRDAFNASAPVLPGFATTRAFAF